MERTDITLEELVYRVPIKTEADDWEEKHPEIFAKHKEEESVDTPLSISSSIEFTPPTIEGTSDSDSDSESDSDSNSDSDSDSNSESDESDSEEEVEGTPESERGIEREREDLGDSDSMDAMEESPTVELPTSPISSLLASPLLSEGTPEPY